MTRVEACSGLFDAIDTIQVVDTHEHLTSEAVRLRSKVDLFYWLSIYASSDLVSAGMPQQTLEELRDSTRPLDERWALFAPFWRHTRWTGYGQALRRAARDLYGVPDIDETTYRELSDKIAAANTPGLYDRVLRERAGIAVALLDPLPANDPTPLEEVDRRFFAPVLRVEDWITPCNHYDVIAIEERTGTSIHTLDALVRAVDSVIEAGLKAGIVAIKIHEAYSRPLSFDKATHHEAELVFSRLRRLPVSPKDYPPRKAPVTWEEAKPLQDYLMHHVIQQAVACGLPLQVHTGLQERNACILANSNPLHLVNLFAEYREVRFDVFHAGYPWSGEVSALAKNFANVYADLCWVPVISPSAAERILEEWIETVPANKILAFGGDYTYVEGAYAHCRMAREVVGNVLARKVAQGYLTNDEAIELAQRMLRENAAELFKLGL